MLREITVLDPFKIQLYVYTLNGMEKRLYEK